MMERRNFLGAIVAAVFGFVFVLDVAKYRKTKVAWTAELAQDFSDWHGIVGYPGRAFLETGYVYAPYVPLRIRSW